MGNLNIQNLISTLTSLWFPSGF